MPCWRNPSGCPPSPSAAAETPAQTPAGSPPAAGQTAPTPPETGTPTSGASCWPAAAGDSGTPSGPPGPAAGDWTPRPGEDQTGLCLMRTDVDWVGGQRRREEVDESWKQ